MTSLPFTKMQGLGNDFMVVDATSETFSLTPRQIQAAGDRHYGVGFDQLLVVAPAPASTPADFTCLIFNNDGSSAEQCGNGARCIARFIYERGLCRKTDLRLAIAGKITETQLETDGTVTVDIPPPYVEPAPRALPIAGAPVSFCVVNVGNPHAVILTDLIDIDEVAHVGAQLSVHPSFPQGVNVGFMQIVAPDHVHLRVYERGAGLTLACGSGACAAVVAGRQLELLQQQVTVSQPGGDLSITWQGAGANIQMRGPAEFVYEGHLFLAAS